jgi:hypothetical protein
VSISTSSISGTHMLQSLLGSHMSLSHDTSLQIDLKFPQFLASTDVIEDWNMIDFQGALSAICHYRKELFCTVLGECG